MTTVAPVDTLRELPTDFVFAESERNALQRTLTTLFRDPYAEYPEFADEVRTLVKNGLIPDRFVAFCDEQRMVDRIHTPFVSIANCPIDPDLPVWDHHDPVVDKRRRKITFVAEGFLELYAALMEQPILSYLNINDGDRFQDVYPKEDMKETQSQKAIVPLYFHKDLASHFVRPDYVNMLTMRAEPCNHTYTTFACNADALALLDRETEFALRQVEFYTPFSDMAVKGGCVDLGRAANHPVLSDEYDLRYFENRTVGMTERAEEALGALNAALHQVKKSVHLMPGDFVSVYNNFSVHAKEVHEVGDFEALRQRWIVKTLNVDELATHQQHFVADRHGVVNG